MRQRSRGSAASAEPPRDPYGLALQWLGQRELSAAQVRTRLLRRGVDVETVDATLTRLRASGAVDDARVGRAAARVETSIRGRGPGRARLKLKSLGLSDAAITQAMDAVMADVDVAVLLDKALERRLRREGAGPLDPAATRRVVGALVRQGFALGAVLARLRARGTDVGDVE